MKKIALFFVLIFWGTVDLFAYTVYYGNTQDYKYAVWYWEYGSGSWSDWMTPVEGHEGWYETDISYYNYNVIFVSFDKSTETPDWSYKVYQTADLQYDGKNSYYVEGMGWTNSFVQQGECGDSSSTLTWSFDAVTRTLTIEGSGFMNDWTNSSSVPWYEFHSFINKVSLPNGLINIGKYAFSGCDSLTSITIPNSVYRINDYAFKSSGLTSVNLGDSVHIIGHSAFDHCKGLTSITIPSSVTSMNAFYACEKLTAVYISDIAAWCSLSFSGSSSPLYYAKHLYLNGEEVKELVIPEGVTKIGERVFENCLSLTSVSIPNSVTSIGEDAFCRCSSLTSVTIPNNVTSIGSYAFDGCHGLASVEIPNSVTSIGTYALRYVNNVQYNGTASGSPWGAKSINGFVEGMFVYRDYTKTELLGCSSAFIGEVVIPNSVTSIGNYAFYYCSGITSFEIPNSVTTIGYSAFCRCNGLTSLTIPESVDSIGGYAFLSCSNLYEITFLSKVPARLGGDPFHYGEIDTSHKVYIPCGTFEAYYTSWNRLLGGHTLKYSDKFEYKLSVNVNLSNAGEVRKPANICEDTILTARPYTGYEFIQWSDGNTDNPRKIQLTQDTSFTAIFAVQTFDITFVDDNDTILAKQKVEYNTMPVPPADPVKQGDAQYSYLFAGWTPTIKVAMEDATYKATYNQTINQYTITFLNDDNSVLSSKLWYYGEAPTCVQPTKDEDEEYTYSFAGWYPEVVVVTEDATYTATYEATKKVKVSKINNLNLKIKS